MEVPFASVAFADTYCFCSIFPKQIKIVGVISNISGALGPAGRFPITH